MALKPTIGHIDPNCERAEWWRHCYGSLDVPLLSPIPEWRRGPDGTPQRFFKVDMRRLTDEQRERVAAFVADKFSVPIDDVRADMERDGIPILADDVIVSFDARLVL